MIDNLFDCKPGSEEFYQNQRQFAKNNYLDYCKSRGYGITESESRINLYFAYLDKYPVYAEECYQNSRKIAQTTGYKIPMTCESNPDHTYASRASGIDSSYILRLYEYFGIRVMEVNHITEF